MEGTVTANRGAWWYHNRERRRRLATSFRRPLLASSSNQPTHSAYLESQIWLGCWEKEDVIMQNPSLTPNGVGRVGKRTLPWLGIFLSRNFVLPGFCFIIAKLQHKLMCTLATKIDTFWHMMSNPKKSCIRQNVETVVSPSRLIQYSTQHPDFVGKLCIASLSSLAALSFT